MEQTFTSNKNITIYPHFFRINKHFFPLYEETALSKIEEKDSGNLELQVLDNLVTSILEQDTYKFIELTTEINEGKFHFGSCYNLFNSYFICGVDINYKGRKAFYLWSFLVMAKKASNKEIIEIINNYVEDVHKASLGDILNDKDNCYNYSELCLLIPEHAALHIYNIDKTDTERYNNIALVNKNKEEGEKEVDEISEIIRDTLSETVKKEVVAVTKASMMEPKKASNKAASSISKVMDINTSNLINTIKTAENKKRIHDAILDGDINEVRSFIMNGSNVNSKNKNKETPLHLAAKIGNKELVKLLLDSGADKSIMNGSNKLAKDIAIKLNHSELIDIL